jgi:hypothetical protein
MQITCTSPLVNKSTNWDAYREEIDKVLNLSIKFSTPADLDSAAKSLSTLMLQSVRSCMREQIQPPSEIEYPSFIRSMVHQRRQAHKAWQRHHTTDLKKTFNKLSIETTRTIGKWRNDSFSEHLSSSLAPTKEAIALVSD